MEEQAAVTIENLRFQNFEAVFAESADTARRVLLEMIPRDITVGVADSATLRQIGILDKLQQEGRQVVNPFRKELTAGAGANKLSVLEKVVRQAASADLFLTGANVVTQDGKIVSIDRGGNRVTGMVFGPKRVIVVVGWNKIVKDKEEAEARLKTVIVPAHARRKNNKTPCAVAGTCIEYGRKGRCPTKEAPDRMCSVTVVLERKPVLTDISVVIVGEDLGLGWDPRWADERVDRIRENYHQATWVFEGVLPKPLSGD